MISMGRPRKAKLFVKEDVDIETLWDGENANYLINLSNAKGTTKQIVIPEANLFNRSKMLKFLHQFAKLTYDKI